MAPCALFAWMEHFVRSVVPVSLNLRPPTSFYSPPSPCASFFSPCWLPSLALHPSLLSKLLSRSGRRARPSRLKSTTCVSALRCLSSFSVGCLQGRLSSSQPPLFLAHARTHLRSLTIGLMVCPSVSSLQLAFSDLDLPGSQGLDTLHLRVLASSSDSDEERENAARVLRLLNRGRHWVLVVLLLGNVVSPARSLKPVGSARL